MNGAELATVDVNFILTNLSVGCSLITESLVWFVLPLRPVTSQKISYKGTNIYENENINTDRESRDICFYVSNYSSHTPTTHLPGTSQVGVWNFQMPFCPR